MTPARRYTLTDECGNHVRTFQIKMIAGPIKICWQEKNRVKAILLTIRLRLDEHHFLRETIGSVCFFRITIPKIAFPEWHLSELRIGTHSSDGDEFFDATQTCLLNKLHAHHEILVKRLSRILLIVTDATDGAGEMNNQVRSRIVKQPHNIGLFY